MSHKSWLKGLLQRVSKPSTVTIRKRPSFSPVRMEFLEDRTAPATLTWTGAAGTNWNDAGNWTGGGVPSAANNVLNFTAGGSVAKYTSNNDIAGLTGLTINITDASATDDFTITGLNAGVTAVNHSKTDNQATSTTLNLAMTGAAATITDTTGALSILNTANVFDTASTVNVPTGATLTVAVYPSSSLGVAKYNLTGGTLTVGPASPDIYVNAFNVAQGNRANDVTSPAAVGPVASLGTDVQPYPMMADISRAVAATDTQFQTNTRTWGNSDTYFYSGEIFFPNSNNDGTGSIAFAGATDDSAALYIDDVQYYSFTNNTSAYSIDPNTGVDTVTLPTGWHNIDLRFGNGGGGAGVNNNTTTGAVGWVANTNIATPLGKGFGYRVTDASGTETSAAPKDAKLYRRLVAAPNLYGINAVTETGNTVTVTTAAPATNLVMNSSVKVGDQVTIAGVTPAIYNGVWTVAAVTGNTFTYTHPQSGLPAGVVTTSTTLTLPDDGTQHVRYGINAMTESGTTVTVTTAAPGTTTAMPSGVQVGDKIVIAGANVAGFNGTWTVLAVTGNNTFTFTAPSGLTGFTASAPNTTVGLPDSGVRVRIHGTASGTVSNAVSVSGNSTIALDPSMASAALGNLTMASGANLSVVANNPAGQTLSFGATSLAGDVTFSPAAGANLNLVGVVSQTAAAGITKTGAGSLTLSSTNTYTGATTISAGTVNANANGALGTATGAADGTTVASGGQLVIGSVANFTYSTAEVVSIIGTGTTATNGALSSATTSTFAGPITLTGNSWIDSSANTLTLTGGIIAGANQLTFAGAGTVTETTTGITGTGNLVKTLGGTANLSIANPNFTGNINVLGGTLTGGVSASFGAGAAPIAVSLGGALGLAGGATYNITKPLSIAGNGPDGSGALTNIAGTTTATFTSVTLSENAAVGSRAGDFTLTNDYTISSTATVLTFAGAGNVNAPGKITDPTAGAGFYYVGFTGGTGGQSAQQRILNWNYTGATNFNYSSGFASSSLALNGNASIQGNALQLTPNYINQAGSAFATALAGGNINSSFQFQFASNSLSAADGFAFVIQNSGLTALGALGGGLGYQNIGNSLAVEINMYSNVSTFGVGTNGAITHTNDLTPFGIDFHALDANGLTDVFQADVSYTASTQDLKVTFHDVTQNSAPQDFDFPATTIPSSTATVTQVAKIGAGIATLTGANTYTGTTTINAGTLVATSVASLGSGNAPIIAQTAGALGLSGPTFNFTKPLTINGPGVNGALKILSGTTTATFSGPINVTANASIGADAGTLTVTNDFVTAPAVTALTLTGAGNVVLNGNIGSAPPAALPAFQYAGFSGGTGGANSTQNILNWKFTGTGVANPTIIDYSAAKGGFNNAATVPLTLNGGATIVPDPNDPTGNNGALQLTDSQNNEARSAFATVTSSAFNTTFQFQFKNPNADGFAFVVHNTSAGETAVGGGGGGLGIPTTPSLSAQFNMYSAVTTFGFGLNGTVNHPFDLTPNGINFHKLDPNGFTDIFQADITYTAAGAMTATLKDVTTNSVPVTFSTTGTVGITKTGAGVATLAGNNTFIGATAISAGTLVATSVASLGVGGAPITITGTGSLALSGTSFNFGKQLNIAGTGVNGALKSLSGDTTATFIDPINVTANASIGADAGTLTLTNNIVAAPTVTALNFTGAGNVVANGKIGPAATAAPPAYGFAGFSGGTGGANSTQNILNWTFTGTGVANPTTIDYSDAKGGFNNTSTVPLTLNGGAAVVANPNDATKGELQLTDSQNNEARSAFAPVTSSAFNTTFQFQFKNPTADGFAFLVHNGSAGSAALGGNGGNLGMSGITPSLSAQFNMYNGISTFGFGVNGAINHPTDLTTGGINFHKLDANGFTDIFQVDITYTAAGAMAVTLKDVTTDSIPVTFSTTGSLGVTKTGAGTTTLAGANTYTAATTVSAGTLIAASPSALGAGTSVVVTSGGALALPATGGITIPATKALSLKGSGPTGDGALVNLGGANTVSAPITLTGDAAIGANAGTLMVNGTGVNVSSFALTVTGAGDTAISAPITGVATVPAGLVVGQTAVANDGAVTSLPNLGFGFDVDLGFTMGNSTKGSNAGTVTPVLTNLKTWTNNDTWFYKGQIFWPNSNGNGTGTLSFAENIDDSAFLWVDGVQKMNNTAAATPTSSGAITLPTGWHDIEVRFGNGGGGAGPTTGSNWTATKGFGYRIDKDPVAGGANGAADPLAGSTSGADYTVLVDDGTGSTFRTAAVNANALVKTGTGTLSLSGNNTFTRGSSINLVAGAKDNQVTVTGPVNLTGGGTLQIASGFALPAGNTFTLINNDSTDAVTGTFSGLAEGSVITSGANNYAITYKGGDGNDVVLTALAAGAATTTTLVATPLATTGGSSVMFTATVAPTPGALGTVTFLDNGVAITGGSNIAVTNGQAVFSTTTLGVGAHPVTAAYSGAAGFAPSTSNVQNVVISSSTGAPAVSAVTLNGGITGFTGAQHARVVNVTVDFNQPVNLDLNAMTLALHTNNVSFGGTPGQPTGAALPATLTMTASTDMKTWTLTWSGNNTEVGTDGLASLKDGVYDLVIDATKVHSVASPPVNMAANSTTVFHRLYGDVGAPSQTGNDFSALVNSGDNLQFRGAFNKTVGNGYIPYLDFNGDGIVNSLDNLQFRQRFNKNLTWTV